MSIEPDFKVKADRLIFFNRLVDHEADVDIRTLLDG